MRHGTAVTMGGLNVGGYHFDSYTFDCRATATMYGGPGKDHLRGGSGHDTLLGRADGDGCVAERER